MAAILNLAILNLVILDSAILVFPLKLTHTCQDWFPPFAQKKLHSFILTQLDDDSHLEFCHVGFRHLVFFSDSLKNTLTPLWLWLKLIKSDSDSFILNQLDDGSHLEFHHLGFSHLSFSSQTHSHLARLVPTICTKKTFTHSFWFYLIMAAILNSAILDSAILHKALTQTNSIWFKLIHSDSTWWWQPSWILPSWIWPSWIQPS